MTSDTLKIMVFGLIGAFFLCVLPIARTFEIDWPWAYGFFFIMLGNGMGCFITFFHEIGHSLMGWFYGAATIPMFDFVHGGGWAWSPTGQQIPVLVIVWGLMLYGIFFFFRDWMWIRVALGVALIFNIATAFNDWHENVIDFMGPAFEPMIGAFFLYRALYDLAPRGVSERFMNALFGFAMPIHSLIDGWGLLHNADVRQMYWTQKDGQGVGDFDKIATRLPWGDFNDVVHVWMGLSVLCLAIPFVLFLLDRDTN